MELQNASGMLTKTSQHTGKPPIVTPPTDPVEHIRGAHGIDRYVRTRLGRHVRLSERAIHGPDELS